MSKLRIVHIYDEAQIVDGIEYEVFVDMDSGAQVLAAEGLCEHCSTPLIFLDVDNVDRSTLYHDENCPTEHRPRIHSWECYLLKQFRDEYGYDESKVYAAS